jgi:hypothetical protein
MNLSKLFLIFNFLFLGTMLQAITLSTENFNNNNEGWTGGTRNNDRYYIARDATGAEDYSFNQHPLRNIVITFDVRTYGEWETSGNGQDVLKVTANGATTSFYQTDGTYTYSVNAVLDADGDLELRINPDTTNNNEAIWIDNVVIGFISADATNDSYSTVKNTVLTGNVLTNDIGPSISVISNTNPSHGTVTVLANGAFTYTPTTDYMGNDSFTYTIEDANGYEDTGTVSITVTDIATSGYRDFTLRKQLYSKGDMKTIGNSVLVPPLGSDTTNHCATYTNGAYIVNATEANNNYYLCGYHVDTTTAGLSNSTKSELRLPEGAEVVWAGLYWQAIVTNGSFSTNMTVKIRRDESSNNYEDVSPDRLDYRADAGRTGYTSYSAFADVSEYFGQGKWNEGNYTVANIPVHEGTITSLGSYGAWTLVVVYSNPDDPDEKFRSFSVFDGWKTVGSGDPSVDIDVTGFYTPDKNDIVAQVSVFAAEGDRHISGDLLQTTNYNTNGAVTLSTMTNNTFNSSISGGDSRTPNLTNNNGIDIQTFDIGEYLKAKQSTMRFTFTSVQVGNDQDRYWPSMIAFATELYVPQFCYDYGYEQNGRPFTEENNGTAMPYISGYLPNTEDINVSLYIRNQEASDVSADGIMLTIDDINTTEAIYKRNTVAVTYPNDFSPTHKNDATWPLIVSDSYIRNIPIGNMGGEQHAYVYYTLTPQRSGDINIPIDATFSYNLVIPLPNGTTLRMPYSSSVGGERLPMCSVENFSYTPEWGIFSVVDAGLYNAANVDRYYDLTTQVAKRPGNFRVASFDPEALNTPKPVTTIVAVELIDASQFHDVDAACREPSSAVSPRLWIGFENNVSQVNFNAATIQNAINNGMVSDVITGKPSTIALASDFFKTATPNAAFRVSFNTLADQNDSLIQIEQTTQGIRISNFSDIHQVYPHCRQFVTNPQNDNMTNQTSVACSNKGNNSTYEDVAICMECLYGARTQVLCSRDNFAIRPESFTVTLKDFNQTTGTGDISFTGITGNVDRTDRENLASGYNYRFDINATNHIDNQATLGYTRYFATGGEDYNVSLIWEPTSTKTGCNDTNSSRQNFNLLQGTVSATGKHSQIGEYRLNIIDKTWTAVDWNPALQGHQTGSHFLSEVECAPGSTYVPSQASVISLSGTTMENRVGCDISSTHTKASGTQYLDHLLTLNPYKFDMSGISFGIGGLPTAITSGGDGFVYMSDISRDDSIDMSMRATGNIRAVGYDNIVTTNFVKDCYAKPLNFSMQSANNLTHPDGVAYQLRFMDFNSSANLIYDSNVIDLNTTTLSIPLTEISDGNFTKDTAGSLSTISRFNYARTVREPLNPFIGQFSDLDVACMVGSSCMMQADLIATHEATGNRAMDFNVTHAYGRIIPRDVRVFGSVPFSANAWYEVFNAATLMGTALPASRNEALWYTNTQHNDTNYGDGNVTRLQSAPTVSTAVNVGGDDVNGMETYNFGAVADANIPYSRKAHIDTAPWLWYGTNAQDYLDPSNANLDCRTHPCFNINVVPSVGATGSAKTSNKETKGSKKTDSGGGTWKSTSDYAPAIR